MKSIKTSALIFLLVVSLAASFSAASSDADEYPLVSYPLQMFDSSVLCPVIVTDITLFLPVLFSAI